MDFRFLLKRVNEVTNYNLMQYYDVMSRQAMRTVKKIYYLKIVNMALCQQPWPEEIDVFTGPHLRMKQLVYEALEKVCTGCLKLSVWTYSVPDFTGMCSIANFSVIIF